MAHLLRLTEFSVQSNKAVSEKGEVIINADRIIIIYKKVWGSSLILADLEESFDVQESPEEIFALTSGK